MKKSKLKKEKNCCTLLIDTLHNFLYFRLVNILFLYILRKYPAG
jgi:hypothetical protein